MVAYGFTQVLSPAGIWSKCNIKQTNTEVRSPTGSRDDSGAKKRDDRLLMAMVVVRWLLPPPPSADPRIRICGWWGTAGEGRVFLPGLAGGRACVRWLDSGTAEGNRKTGRWLVGGDSGSAKTVFRWGTAALSLLWFLLFFFYFNIQASSFLSLYLHHWRTSRHCFSHRDSGVCVCVFSSNYSTLLKPAPLGSNRKYSQDFLSRSHALKQDTSAEPAHCLNWFHNCCRHFARVRVCFSSIRYQLPVE